MPLRRYGVLKGRAIASTPESIDLTGWSLADRLKQTSPLGHQTIDAGAALAVGLSGDGAQLSTKGGIITLLDPNGVKVHGVSYTREHARSQGHTIVF